MRALLACFLLAACAGPTQRPIGETPTARTRRPPSLAPPATGDDKERYQLNQQFEDMRDASQAHREHDHADAQPSAASGSGGPGSPAPATKPIKKRPAEQAPPQPPATTR
jgi:hypothetical protein